MFEIQKPYLQKIIGVDKKNPVFTVWRDPESSGGIHVYFGTELMEVVPETSSIPIKANPFLSNIPIIFMTCENAFPRPLPPFAG